MNPCDVNELIAAYLKNHEIGYPRQTDQEILNEEARKLKVWENERRVAQAERIRRYNKGCPELSYDEWQVRGFQVIKGQKAYRYEYGVALFGRHQVYGR